MGSLGTVFNLLPGKHSDTTYNFFFRFNTNTNTNKLGNVTENLVITNVSEIESFLPVTDQAVKSCRI
jgi:hypothetical protein